MGQIGYDDAMGFERQPNASTEKSRKNIETPRINFSPEKIFGQELDAAQAIAMQRAGVQGNFTDDTFRAYIGYLEKFRLAYGNAAEQQGEGKEAKMVVNVAFSSFRASELASHREYTLRSSKTGLSERIASAVHWQQYAAQYIGTLNDRYDQRTATYKAQEFWNCQERVRKTYYGHTEAPVAFEKFKNGILRSVALERILTHTNGWEVVPDMNPVTDAVQKIDMIAQSDSGNTFLIQIKSVDTKDDDAHASGWHIVPVDPRGPTEYEEYMKEFQRGMKQYIIQRGLDASYVHGVYIELSAGRGHINKETGMPNAEFARDVALRFESMDASKSMPSEVAA